MKKLTDTIKTRNKELKTSLIQVKIKPSLKNKAQNLLDKLDISWNDLVESAIEQLLSENEK